jgi:trigger factor
VEISIPVQEVEHEIGRATDDMQKRARLRGFRPGKAPATIIRKEFSGSIRQKVLEALIPKYLDKRLEDENLKAVGTPDIKDVHFHDGEPLRFTAEFETLPEIELGDYQGVEIPYHDPEVTDEDVNKRIDELREQKSEFVNLDPRPIQDGDFAVLALESVGGLEGEPIKQDEMVIEVGGADTLPGFTENLRGTSPGDDKEFEVAYPEDYGSPRVAGKAVKFHATVKGIRRKDLPELNDEFVQELGDYRNVEELREAVRKAIFAARQREAQLTAKNAIIDKLVDAHDFPVPEVFVERQIRTRVENSLRAMAAEGVDPRSIKLDWEKLKETQRDKAVREVKASLLLGRIADREAIAATREDVDREVEHLARAERQPVAALQMRLEKEGLLGRIASQIQTDKTLNFLFEHARKTAE